MSAKTFLDTNVLVRVYDSLQPKKGARAREVIAAERDSGDPTLSANVLGEMFSVLSKPIRYRGQKHPPLLSRDAAGEKVRLAADLRTVALTPAHVLDALRLRGLYQMDWWDAVNLASAKAAGCDRILTEDVPSQPVVEGVAFENPFEGIVEDDEVGP